MTTRAGCAAGAEAPERARLAMGGNRVGRVKDRVHPGELRKWVRLAECDVGKRTGLTTDERERLRELERENRELKRANETIRKAAAFFAQAELDRRPK